MAKYARDEFDRVPETSARQGVHRAVTEARRSRGLVPILAVGAAALMVGLLSFVALPKLGFPASGSPQAVSVEQGSSAIGSPAATASSPAASGPAPSSSAPSGPAPGTPATSPTPSTAPTPSATPTPSAAAAVDKAQPVAVFNSTTTAGLAGRVGGTVSSAGWTVGTLGNWGGATQPRSVIFYKGAAQKANAEALGSLLGITTVVESAEFALPLVVVLAPGFR
jgi:hypothetical protein